MQNIPSDTYKEEALELVDQIETMLIELETDPSNMELVNRIFRALHTIKGSGSMFGFDDVVKFTHRLESIFDAVRKDKLQINKEIIDITLSSCDHIRLLIESPEDINSELEVKLVDEMSKYSGLVDSSPAPGTIEEDNNIVRKPDALDMKLYRISFVPSKDLFLRGVKVNSLINELIELGDCHTFAHVNYPTSFEEYNPEECITSWLILLASSAPIESVKDVFIFVEDYCEIKIEIVDTGTDSVYINRERLGEILVDRKMINKKELEKLLKEKKLIGKLAVEKGLIDEDELNSALKEQEIIREERSKRITTSESATIRVKHKKLDDLVNLVGELVTLQARLSQYANKNKTNELEVISERLERITIELRDNTMNLRMVPVSKTFNSFYRLVRDLSTELNKDVELEIDGGDTELDKNVIEVLKDPLMHIIRNSIDHGIESPEERVKAGKTKKARINITAEYSGANVLIKVEDDGQGLNLAKIKKRAIDRNIISEDTQVTDKEIMAFIFAPGFSTSDKTTNVSGRGVGMDVVKKNIEKLRGYVEIDSVRGKGTVISLKIPLTLAIIDGLLVEIGKDYYIINLSAVDECIDLTDDILVHSRNKSLIKLRNEVVPYVDLRRIFGIVDEKPEIEQLVITNVNNNRIGLKVDNVIGQNQTVIKSVGRVYKDVEEIAGATILGDGSIALILDINKVTTNLINENMANASL